jgi:hypothetical protein
MPVSIFWLMWQWVQLLVVGTDDFADILKNTRKVVYGLI